MGKLDLDKLKVESFVTSLNSSDKQTVAGGAATNRCSELPGCDMTNDILTQCIGGCQGGSQAHNCDTDLAVCEPRETVNMPACHTEPSYFNC